MRDSSTPSVSETEVTARNCRCCSRPVLIMCETDYCGERCRSGKCGHPVAELAQVIAAKSLEIRPIWEAMERRAREQP